jgi:alkylation response protein AidB-like acyl-CoA dehydrogenase
MAEESSSNRVLTDEYRPSTNFHTSDLIFRHYLQSTGISASAQIYFTPILEQLGRQAAVEMDDWSQLADKYPPQLVPRTKFGEDLPTITFHPAYHALLKIAVSSEMFRVKWEPNLRKKFSHELHTLGFSAGYLFAMSELGQYCPLCMTDGAARLVDRFCTEEDRERILPHIYTSDVSELYTGAMFLTEKSGGSDVGRNLVRATHIEGSTYALYGEKWFCSNANADIMFVLARTDAAIGGTRGLSIFLVEKTTQDGSPNPIQFIRLKDKLGVRSMASAECVFNGTIATRVGEEFQGFKIMTEMINLSRLYNAVAALAGSRRALIEAFTFVRHRITFGKKAIEHALIRHKLAELGSLHCAGFYLTFKAIRTLDAADNGDSNAAELIRLLTPMTKKWTAEKGVYIARESMELMGGLGYIEDTIMPKLLRDLLVLPIWEGAGNIMILDMLRAFGKSQGYTLMREEIRLALARVNEYGNELQAAFEQLDQELLHLHQLPQDEMEVIAKRAFETLTTFYQIALMVEYTDEISSRWTMPAIYVLSSSLLSIPIKRVFTTSEIEELLGWDIPAFK